MYREQSAIFVQTSRGFLLAVLLASSCAGELDTGMIPGPAAGCVPSADLPCDEAAPKNDDDSPEAKEPPLSLQGGTGTTVSISPVRISLPIGGRTSFSSKVELAEGVTDGGVAWLQTGGLVTPDGHYTAPRVAGIYYVIARSTGDSTAQAVAEIEVKQVWVKVTPSAAQLQPGMTRQFTAEVSGTSDHRVAWSIAEGTGPTTGTISARGLYFAPEHPLNAPLRIRATSVVDPSSRGEALAWVTAEDQPRVFVHPAASTLETGETLLMHSTVLGAGADEQSAHWTLEPVEGQSTGGAFVSGNVVVAGMSPGIVRVRATSTRFPDHSDTAIVRVVEPATPPIRGVVKAAEGILVPSNARIGIAALGSEAGRTSRAGLGAFRIRGSAQPFPVSMLAWVDSGSGKPRVARDLFGMRLLEAGGSGFFDITLTQVDLPPIDALVPEAPDCMVLRDDAIFVRIPPLFEQDSYASAQLEFADTYEIELSLTQEPWVAVRRATVPAGTVRAAILSDLPSSSSYQVRYRGLREREGAASQWSPVESIDTQSDSLGGSIEGRIHLNGVAVNEGASLYLLVSGGDRGAVLLHPADAEAFTITQVPEGVHELIAILDQNNDGVVDVGGPDHFWKRPGLIHVQNGPVTNIDFVLGVDAAQIEMNAERSEEWTLQILALPSTAPLTRVSLEEVPEDLSGMLRIPMDFPLPDVASPFTEMTFNLPPGTPDGSRFRVATTNHAGRTDSHELVLRAPSRPENLEVIVSQEPARQTVHWNVPDTSASSHQILRIRGLGYDEETLLPGNASSFQIPEAPPLTAGNTYDISLTSHDRLGNSATSFLRYEVPAENP